MAAKIPQALKFTEGLAEDLKFLAGVKGMTYNGYVESVLSSHVLVQKRTVMEMKNGSNRHVTSDSSILTKKEPVEYHGLVVDDDEPW